MNAADDLGRGRDAFERRSWKEGYGRLRAADERAALDPTDLQRLATAPFLIGLQIHGGWPGFAQPLARACAPTR